MAIWNRLYFPAFPASSGGHVTKFWPMGSNWKWDMKLPVKSLKIKGLFSPFWPDGAAILDYHVEASRWGWQSKRIGGAWVPWHCGTTMTSLTTPTELSHETDKILPCLRHFHFGFSITHSWTLILSGIAMQEKWRVGWEIITETVGFDRKKGFQRSVLWGSNF